MDDGLTGTDSVVEAIQLQKQLQELFPLGEFLLQKWKSYEALVLQHISPKLRDNQSLIPVPDPDEYMKTLGIHWNSSLNHFRLSVAKFPESDNLTKRLLISTTYLQQVHTFLVTSKTKVTPIKHLTIPRLELCSVYLLAQLLHYIKQVLHVLVDKVYV